MAGTVPVDARERQCQESRARHARRAGRATAQTDKALPAA